MVGYVGAVWARALEGCGMQRHGVLRQVLRTGASGGAVGAVDWGPPMYVCGAG